MNSTAPWLRTAWIAALLLLPAVASAAEDTLPPQIVHEPCEFYPKGKKFEIYARFYDDSPIFDPKVVYRSGKEDAWKNVAFNKSSASEDFVAVLKPKDLKGVIEYFIETFDENGNGPARFGSPEAPIKVKPSENPPACTQVRETDIAAPPPVFNATPKEADAPRPQGTPGTRRSEGFTATSGAAPPPAPPQDECSRADAPVTCSAGFWVGVSFGILAVVAGGVVGILAAAGVFSDEEAPPVQRDFVRIRVVGADPTTAPLRSTGRPGGGIVIGAF